MKLLGPAVPRRLALVWLAAWIVGAVAVLLGLLFPPFHRSLAGAAALAAGSVLLVLTSISWWLIRRHFQPLRDLVEGAEQLAAGETAEPLPVPTAKELAALALSVNKLADELQDQLRLREEERDRLQEISDRDVAQTLRQAEIRRDLVANVSHELKTPLTAIRGYAESLENGALEDPQFGPRFVRRILDQCRRLEVLLRDQLSLSRLEQIDQVAEPEAIDLGEAARQAVEVLAPKAQEHEIELKLRVGDVPSIQGTRSEVDNLLLNLVENAIKYNRPGGEVRIAISMDGDVPLIEVADTGIGIPEEGLERIFERFYRVDKGRAREQGGTGLGLAIVKHAVRLLGGKVEVESRLGEGSVFRVRLPGAPG